MPHIFISYAKKDTYDLAARLRDELVKLPGVTTWMDERLRSGKSWARQIEDEIDRADYVLVLVSPDVNRRVTPTQTRSFVLNEIDYAQQDGKEIIPVMAQRTKMPVQLAGIQYIDFLADTNAGIQKLIADISRRAGIASPSPAVKPQAAPSSPVRASQPTRWTVWIAAIVTLIIILGIGSLILSNQPGNTPTLTHLQRASTPVARNADWMPVEQDFGGVTMVLVPAGCFMMGNDPQGQYWNGSQWVQGVPDGGEQCFDVPFWIDKYEVTNGQFAQFGGVAGRTSNWTGTNLHRESITWFEARNYCEQKRRGRLSTEAEWEYAARGPDNLVFPWGNEFVGDNVVYYINSNMRTADVGSRSGGASWVGALDLSGNVWEWVSSLYVSYKYDITKAENKENTNSTRGLRGGSWGNTVTDLRAAYRYGISPSNEFNGGGIRCARSSSS